MSLWLLCWLMSEDSAFCFDKTTYSPSSSDSLRDRFKEADSDTGVVQDDVKAGDVRPDDDDHVLLSEGCR